MTRIAVAALAVGIALSAAPVAAQGGPASPPFENFGRADALARACQNAEEVLGRQLSVGTCLALERENAVNEEATFCAHLQQSGYLPIYPEEGEEGEPILTVGDCVTRLKAL